MLPRNCCTLPPASRPSARADQAGPPGSSPASAPKSATFVISTLSISKPTAGSTSFAASAASL
eukprot:11132430-Alexandrium_andersonii.AAC.1